jgi:hypothetical protein
MLGRAGQVYFDRPGVASVTWDETRRTVVVEWVGGASSEEFSALLEAEVRALQDHGGVLLLADCRRQPEISPADQDRADREWVPRVNAAGLRRFAVVLPKSRMAAVDLQDRVARYPDGAFEARLFFSVEQAQDWLSEPLV